MVNQTLVASLDTANADADGSDSASNELGMSMAMKAAPQATHPRPECDRNNSLAAFADFAVSETESMTGTYPLAARVEGCKSWDAGKSFVALVRTDVVGHRVVFVSCLQIRKETVGGSQERHLANTNHYVLGTLDARWPIIAIFVHPVIEHISS